MTHIDEQISQIFNFLSPNQSATTNKSSNTLNTTQPSSNITQSSSLRPPSSLHTTAAALPDTNPSTLSFSPQFDTSSFYSDINANIPFFDANPSSSSPTSEPHDIPIQSKSNEQLPTIPPNRPTNVYESKPISIPPPPSVYNRSANSPLVTLGISTTPRGSVSNKIVPAPGSPPSTGSKHSLSASFRPISNTRFTPGHSPKPKVRSHQNRSDIKHQRQCEKSTIIELEPPTQTETTSKTVPLASSLLSSTKSGSKTFRRFKLSSRNSEKASVPSSTLLRAPTSDDERPMSPSSSGNDDDDHRPLTSSSSKHYHQTLL